MSKIEVNTVEPQCGTTLTIGASGDTVTFPAGVTVTNNGTQTGFGRTGTVDWQTTKKTANFTATSGEGYFCDTAASGAFTLTLPSSPSAGDIVALKDYNGNFATANLTIGRGGSNLSGTGADKVLDTNHLSLTLVYVDATEGWVPVEEGTGFIGEGFVEATGGTITTSGNDKIHTFTGPGTFTVSALATCSANNQVSYVVAAAGGGGGNGESGAGHPGGGGGAGGFREDKSPTTPYTSSPLEGAGTINVTASAFPITVGGGGAGGSSTYDDGSDGGASTFSTITSAGGGGGGAGSNPGTNRGGRNGGSGGGSGSSNSSPQGGGSGNQPPVSPPQGNNGGPGAQTSGLGGGGGGATAAGTQYPGSGTHPGGAGATTSITASPVTYSAGGSVHGSGAGPAGGANTGNAGGAGINDNGGAGGSGVVIIRYKYQ